MRYLFCSILLFLGLSARANFSFNENCQKAYFFIIDFKFEQGRALIEQEKKRNPANAIPALLENYIDYFQTFVTERPDYLEAWKDHLDERIDRFKSEKQDNPWYLFCQAQCYLQLAFVRFKFKEYTSGAYDIHKAFKMLEKNQALYPSFKLNLMGLGVLHSIVGTVPEEYRWVANLVGMKGTIKQGTAELQNLMQSCKGTDYEFVLPETCVLLALLDVYLQKDYEGAEKSLDYAAQNYHTGFNPLMCFIRSTILLHTGRNEEALKVMKQRNEHPEAFSIPYLDYMEGLGRLNKLDESCILSFNKYLEEFKGISFVKASYQKMAWFALLKGDKVEYKRLMQLCKTKNQALIDEDKQALNEASTAEQPNIYLLKARLFYDGGYYTKALSELAGKAPDQFPRMRDKIEYTYRLARIYQKVGQLEESVKLYETTLKNGENLSFHFAANSALELGYIFEKKEPAKALSFFKHCLEMRHHEYQNGIDQKAKAGISRLSTK